MISVFTPSHQSQWLDDCYASLCAQTYPDWEWIVVLNGGAEWPWPKDARVKVFPSDEKGVGALKSRACSLARGEILLELDHDDVLARGALECVADVFAAAPDASLVYSDSAQVNADLSRNEEKFAEGNGWVYYDAKVEAMERTFDVMPVKSKPPTPHNVSYIWYAPNHLRAFTKKAYTAAGGYDKSRTICDDADLMCRLYQVGPFVHIPICLYLQRLHPANTQREPATNAQIQAETVRLYDENIQPNALKWAEREGLPCYDLGGRHNPAEGYQMIDSAVGLTVERLMETTADDSVGVYRAVDFLEHILDSVWLMNEIYRTLAPGGMLLSLTPSTDGRGAWADPTHVSYFNELSFRYYCDTEFQKYVPAITARFRQSRLLTYYPTPWHEENQLPYVLSNLVKEG